MRVDGMSDPKYTPDVCHSLRVSHRLDFKNAKFDDFWKFKKTFCKNFFYSRRNGDQESVQ